MLYSLTIVGVNNDLFDLFLWEVFTTKPHYTRGELTYLGAHQYNICAFSQNITHNSIYWIIIPGEVRTPWTAFSIVHRQSLDAGMYVCMYVCMYVVCMVVCIVVCMVVCMVVWLYLCMCGCIYVCMYVCMYVLTFICCIFVTSNSYQ